MIVDVALTTIGITLGLLAVAAFVVPLAHGARWLARSRPAWWLRARLAIRRARPTRMGR